MKGWFDAFRTDGGPTLYHHSNRTAVAGDISTITILIIFVTVFIAFLLIFPGVRSQVSAGSGKGTEGRGKEDGRGEEGGAEKWRGGDRKGDRGTQGLE